MIGFALGILGRFLPSLPSLSGVIGAVGAALAAVPATIIAIGQTLKIIGESPVLSLLLGGGIGGVAAFFWGLSFDAPIRERHKRDAISSANARAAIAISAERTRANAEIEKARADFERRISELRKTAPSKSVKR